MVNFLSKNIQIKSPLWKLSIITITVIILYFILSTAESLKVESQNSLKRELQGVLSITSGAINFLKHELKNDQEAITKLPASEIPLMANAHGYLGHAIYFKDPSNNLVLFKKEEFIPGNLIEASADAIRKAHAGTFAIQKPSVKTINELIFVTAIPIKNNRKEIVGVLASIVDLHAMISEATQVGRMGATGETYAVNKEGQLITQSRFKDSNGVIRHSIFKEKSQGFNVVGYPDYRGIEVVGAWLWDKDFNIGIITEIDKEEAYKSFNIIQNLVWVLIIVVIIAMAVIFLLREIWTRNKINILEQKEEGRKELLSTVSHDLKNPLNALLISNDLLMRSIEAHEKDFEKRRNLLGRSHEAADHMKKLINDLLDVSRIEEGKLEIRPSECDSTQILKENLKLIEQISEEKGISLTSKIPEDLPKLWADPNRLSQVFSNLLGNAVKFTHPGGKISVEVKVFEKDVRFSITDSGPGIAPEDQKHLFEKFWQAKAAKGFGTGLGLSICKEIVKAHGGEIWFETEVGVGTTFYFSIPSSRPLP